MKTKRKRYDFMLGWGVTVTREDDESAVLSGWTAEPGLIRSMITLVNRGDADLIEDHGGYPDIYQVNAGVLRDLLMDADPLLCRDRAYELYVDWQAVDKLADDDVLLLQMWDQS